LFEGFLSISTQIRSLQLRVARQMKGIDNADQEKKSLLKSGQWFVR